MHFGNKLFFNQPVKTNKKRIYEKLVEIPKKKLFKTRNLLDYSYHQNYYKLIGIVLSRQANKTIGKIRRR